MMADKQTAIAMAFEHFYHLDHSNAAVHMAVVKYSPITFALAEMVAEFSPSWDKVQAVITDRGKYDLDLGR